MTRATFKCTTSGGWVALTPYDLVILGQGSAAFAAAIKANDLGARTAMIGTNLTRGTVLGGTCVNVGCMPSKRLITVSTLYHQANHNSFQGIRYEKGRLNFQNVINQKDVMVRKFRREKYRDVLRNLKNLTYYDDAARFESRTKISIGNRTIEGRRFVIATGARARLPSIDGIEDVDYLTNEEALNLKELPESLTVIGGRALALEFAQMYAQFGSRVTVLQRSTRLLPEDEPPVSKSVAENLKSIGITVQTGVHIRSIHQKGSGKIVRYSRGGQNLQVESEQVIFATGRTPNTESLGLSKVGVETDTQGFVKVNREMRTSAPHVWAAGDVTGEPMLETLAAKEGSIAADNALSKTGKRKINLDEVPSAVFTYPEVARVGLTEAQALERGVRCSCVTLPLDLVPKAHIIADTRGLIKLVTNRDTKQVIGVHIVAPHAADLIHEGVLAVKFGLTIDDVIDTVHVFPTLSESIKLAAQSFYRDVGALSCCTE